MRRFAADLHIHTALSPCAMDEMTPPAIVRTATDEGLDMIAICDHNSARNAAAVQEAAGADLSVVAGMEITTVEEIHVLGLFPSAAAACAAGAEVHATLRPVTEADRRIYGEQPVMNARGDIVATEDRLLAFPSGFDLSGAVALIRRHGGLAIASHVDRPANSVFSQLGLFPTDVQFDAIEISSVGFRASRGDEFAALGLPMVTSSDGHFLTDIGTCSTRIEMEDPTFDELALAVRGRDGRRCRLVGGWTEGGRLRA